jgi:hypothetical protein
MNSNIIGGSQNSEHYLLSELSDHKIA